MCLLLILGSFNSHKCINSFYFPLKIQTIVNLCFIKYGNTSWGTRCPCFKTTSTFWLAYITIIPTLGYLWCCLGFLKSFFFQSCPFIKLCQIFIFYPKKINEKTTVTTLSLFYPFLHNLLSKGGVASMTFFNISVNNGASRFYFCMYTHLML